MRELTKNRFVVAMIYVVLFAAFIFSCAYLIKAFDLFIRFILKAFIPVLIGLFIATVFEPVLKYLEKRRINRTVSAILILVILNVLLAFMLAEGIYILVNECLGLVSNLQNIDYDKIYATLNHLFSSVKSIYTDLPRPIVSFIQSGVNEIANILNQVATMSLKVINVIPATLKGITIWFFSVLSSFFFMRDRHKMRAWLIQNFSAQVYKEMSSVAFKVIDSVVDYAKSQIILGLREFASIKIVASQVGISTFTTLVSIYAGVEIFGAWGFIIGPLLVVFLKAVFETGAIKKIRENLFLQKRSEQA